MKHIGKYIRKIIVAAIGVPIIIVGVILIPLPGPGLLICFLGFFILSLEFDWARPYFEKAKAQFKKIIDQSKIKRD